MPPRHDRLLVCARRARATVCGGRRGVRDGKRVDANGVYAVRRREVEGVAAGELLLEQSEEIILGERWERRRVLRQVPEVIEPSK